jgi:hypothetical protein
MLVRPTNLTILRRQGPALKETGFLGGSVPFRFDPCRLRGRRPAKRPPARSDRRAASLHVRVGLGRPVTASLTTGLHFPWRALHVNKPTGSTPFCSVSSVHRPSAHLVSARPTTSTPAVLVAVAVGRSTPDRLAIPQPSLPSTPPAHQPVRLPFPPSWGP